MDELSGVAAWLQATGPYGAPPPEVLAAEREKKGGFLGGLFKK